VCRLKNNIQKSSPQIGFARMFFPGRNTSTHPTSHVSEHIYQFCRAWRIMNLCPAVHQVLK